MKDQTVWRDRLDTLLKLRQRGETARAQTKELQTKIAELSAQVQARNAPFKNKKTWDQDKDVLLAQRQELDRQLRQAQTALGADSPAQRQAQLQNQLRQAQERLAQLESAQSALEQIEQLTQRWQAAQQKMDLARQLAAQRAKLVPSASEQQLLETWRAWQAIQAHVQMQTDFRAQVSGLAIWLGENLPDGKPAKWAAWIPDKLDALAVPLGACLQKLKTECETLEKGVKRNEKKWATLCAQRDALIARITPLEEENRQAKEKAADDVQQWAEWSAEMTALDLPPAFEEPTEAALKNLYEQLTAQHQHLEWFHQAVLGNAATVANPSRRGGDDSK